MPNKVSYEWAIEEADAYGDVFNVDHREDLSEALSVQRAAEARGEAASVEIALVRHEGNDADSETARHYAYFRDDRTLPENFDQGPPVPQRFHKEAEAARSVAASLEG